MREEDVSLEDARDLLEAAARFVELAAARSALESRVLLLARRLTRDWRLADEEAIKKAGELAKRLLLEKATGHGR